MTVTDALAIACRSDLADVPDMQRALRVLAAEVDRLHVIELAASIWSDGRVSFPDDDGMGRR